MLAEAVERFVADVGAALETLSGKGRGAHDAEALIEASNIVAAVVDADGRQADAELNAYLTVIGPRLDPPLYVTAQRLREGGMLEGRASWLQEPSVLFELLRDADAKNGTSASTTYYERAMRLCHVTAALDLVPSPAEIAAIDAFRVMLLRQRPSTTAAPKGDAVAEAAVAKVDVELPPARPLPELLAELDALVGLEHVKGEVRRLTSLLEVQRIRAERGLPTVETSHHLVFTGNPGTGKTTVARLLSQIYRAVGVVAKGHLVETDRSRLVAGYVGQTALKTKETLDVALGGMLLVDEAYALARGGENDFGLEAIDTIVKFMEDHRDELAIVAAGYTEEMATFIDSNPGLKSRFTRTIHFPDYTTDELVEIFLGLGERSSYHASDDALAEVRRLIELEPRTRGFGNARFVRNLFETAVAHHALRIAPLVDPSDEQLTTLTAADIAPVDTGPS